MELNMGDLKQEGLNQEGLKSLIGKQVTLFCVNYIYTEN